MIGPVLTSARSIDSFLSNTRAYPLVKVVDAWGMIDRAWNDADRKQLLAQKTVILRTSDGDPSYKSALWYPDPNAIEAKVKPWITVNPYLYIEIGNEPDVLYDELGENEHFIWVYRYFLNETVSMFRRNYPNVKLIAPCPRVNAHATWYRWIEIMQDVLLRCDYLSAHVYGWHRLALDETDTQQYIQQKRLYDQIFRNKPVMVTECGIHDVMMNAHRKLIEYTNFQKALPDHWKHVLFYHYDEVKAFHKEYAVLP